MHGKPKALNPKPVQGVDNVGVSGPIILYV